MAFESLRYWMQRVWRQISGAARFHPPEPADSVSLPRRPVATRPIPAEADAPSDALTANTTTPSSPTGPLSTIQPSLDPDSLPCSATIRPDLGALNIRSGPGLTFPRIERAAGGMRLGAAGLSGPDKDGFPWVWLTWADGSGWVRRDLVTLQGDCAALADAAPQQVEPPYTSEATDPGDRWPLPVAGRIVQDYHNSHRAYDLVAVPGTQVTAGGAGLLIKRMDCATYQGEAQLKTAFDDPDWGFGDGSTVIVRHDYADLPATLRATMDAQDLSGGYAYVQYAHLDRLDASLDEAVTAETILGTTGLTGASAGPTLHLAVKIGRLEKIDGHWAELPFVHPALLFYLEPAAE